jgi:hypothetical protein
MGPSCGLSMLRINEICKYFSEESNYVCKLSSKLFNKYSDHLKTGLSSIWMAIVWTVSGNRMAPTIQKPVQK